MSESISPELYAKLYAPGNWVFCQDADCRRCYRRGEERPDDEGRFFLCAYEDCEYGDYLDAIAWETMRPLHPELPEVPERGARYLVAPSTEQIG